MKINWNANKLKEWTSTKSECKEWHTLSDIHDILRLYCM